MSTMEWMYYLMIVPCRINKEKNFNEFYRFFFCIIEVYFFSSIIEKIMDHHENWKSGTLKYYNDYLFTIEHLFMFQKTFFSNLVTECEISFWLDIWRVVSPYNGLFFLNKT